MTCLSKIKLLVATVLTACAFSLPLAGDAWAFDNPFSCDGKTYCSVFGVIPAAQRQGIDAATKKKMEQIEKKLDTLLQEECGKIGKFSRVNKENITESLKNSGKLAAFNNLVTQYQNAVPPVDLAALKDQLQKAYDPNHPLRREIAVAESISDGVMASNVDGVIKNRQKINQAYDNQHNAALRRGATNQDLEKIEENRQKSLQENLELAEMAAQETARSNAGYCDINALKSDYMSNCYSCVVVGNLIKTFMSISAITYPVAQEAGVKLLVIGMMIWLAFYVLKKLSSFVSLEPMKMLQELFSFFFKCLIAYVLMTSGLRNITDLIVDPILKAGADYGISIINSVSEDLLVKTEIVERTKDDAPYQAEPVQNKEQAKEVEKETGGKVTGEVHTGKYRPEDISKTKESGMDYCCWGDERDNGYHAFGAHQLDFFAGGAADFAISCKDTNKEIYNAYVSAGKKSGTALRSALTPIFKRMCSTDSGKADLKKLQDSYYISKYKYILKYASDTLGINLNLNNYAEGPNFTLAAALISGQIHNPAAIKRVINGIKAQSGSCASRSCNMDALAKQVYAGLKSELGFSERYGTGKDSELDLCQRVLSGGDIDSSGLSSSGSSGYGSYDYRQTDHYYIVKKGDQEFDLVPISKEDNKAVLDTTVFDKIMLISRKADNAVSLNFVIGDALVCHSMHAGAIQFAKKVTDLIGLEFYFPDVWIWLCGAVIWVFALMVALAVNFYLLDLSFKIGFALLALPITIGLWPFEKFKDKFKVCVDIIINAAGTFMFLGITTGLSVVLISTSLGGTEELFSAIENDRKEYISNTFSLTGAKFFLILFAFLYSHKMISGTVSKLANKFFPSVTNGLTPMHHMTTQMIDMGVSAVKTVAGGVAGAVTGGASTAAKAVAKTAARQAIKGIRKGISKGGSGVKKMLGGK